MNKITKHQARLTGNVLNVDWSVVDFDQFLKGMGVEFEEHGPGHPETDITRSDLIKVGKVALAHLREFPDYYTRLDKMEKAGKKEKKDLKEFSAVEGGGGDAATEVNTSSPINPALVNNNMLDSLARSLGLDLRKVVPEELSSGIIDELGKMATFTTGALTHEKLVRATLAAYKALMSKPDNYSNPDDTVPYDGHVLSGNIFAPYHYKTQRENAVPTRPLLLREMYSEELLDEGRKFFDIRAFKELKEHWEQQVFLNNNAKILDSGSSRDVYLINSRHVLKFAPGPRGQAQNEAEVELFTNPNVKPFITEIYDYDPEYNWLISELVRPLRGEEEFERLTKVNWDDFVDILNMNPEADTELPARTKYKSSEFVKQLLNMLEKTDIEPADLETPKHWGRTGDNRVVLLDYGFTTSVRASHYSVDQASTRRLDS